MLWKIYVQLNLVNEVSLPIKKYEQLKTTQKEASNLNLLTSMEEFTFAAKTFY